MKRILLLAAALQLYCLTAGAQISYWQPVSSGTSKKLTSISFGSPGVGYIAGEDSLLLRSLDGGLSWTPLAFKGLSLSAATPDIIHINFVSAGSGFAIVGDHALPEFKGVLHRTADSGRTWLAVDAGNIAMSRTFFFDASNGFGIGSAFFTGKTIVKLSGGAWGPEQYFTSGSQNFLYAIDFRNAATGITGGDGGQVYRTFNGGATWDTVQTVVDTTITSLKFLNDSTILGGTDDRGAGVIISHDTGRTWDVEPNTLTFAYPVIKGLAVSGRDSFIAVGHASFEPYGLILWHGNGFANNQMAPRGLNDVAMRDDSVAYIVGDSGTILTNRQALLHVPGYGSAAAAVQVFPNPATDVCYTQASFPHTVELYDMAGRVIMAEMQPSIKHTLHLKGLTPGVYVVACSREGEAPACSRLVVW